MRVLVVVFCSLSVAVMPRSSISEPKAAMVRRLRDMTDQMKVIDEMSQNIEREFKSSRLVNDVIFSDYRKKYMNKQIYN